VDDFEDADVNVKPGDLAYMIEGPHAGRVFEVIDAWGNYRGNHVWNVKTREELKKWSGGASSEPLPPSKYGQAYDHWLRPISGVPVDDEVTEDLKEPA
jgi:hypothetical protein